MMTSFPLSVLKGLFFRLLVGHSPLSGSFPDPCFQVEPASEISIYRYSGVVFTAALSYLILGETLSTTSILGAMLILAGIFWVFEYRKRFRD